MTKIELLAEIDAGYVTYLTGPNAIIIRHPGRPTRALRGPEPEYRAICQLVDGDLVEAAYTTLDSDRIPLISTVKGQEFLDQAERVGAVRRLVTA